MQNNIQIYFLELMFLLLSKTVFEIYFDRGNYVNEIICDKHYLLDNFHKNYLCNMFPIKGINFLRVSNLVFCCSCEGWKSWTSE